jgi:hypothetical protein
MAASIPPAKSFPLGPPTNPATLPSPRIPSLAPSPAAAASRRAPPLTNKETKPLVNFPKEVPKTI